VKEEADETNLSIVVDERNSNKERANLIHMFKQIDQAPLSRIGVPKAEVSEVSIP
jgi:hypothetical protein